MGLDGILLIDKEKGWTSHDVVAKARTITRQRRIGHTGTLDPMATGLLVLCLGQATRLVEYMTARDKRYQGEITLGVATSTDDADGDVLATSEPPDLDETVLRSLESRFSGRILQRPPAFSAVQVNGQRGYFAARKGRPLDIPERNVVVHDLALDRAAPGVLSIRIHCGSGTYVRSIARDIGHVLGCGAHLSSLRRVRVGAFDLIAAINLTQLGEAVAEKRLEDMVRAPDEGIEDHAAAIVSVAHADRLRHGSALESPGLGVPSVTAVRVYTTDGAFIAIASVAPGGQIRPIKVFSS